MRVGDGGFLVGTNGFQVRTSGLRVGGATVVVGAWAVVVDSVVVTAVVVVSAVVVVVSAVVNLVITGKTLFCVTGVRAVVVVLLSSLSGMWLWWFGGILPGLGASISTFGMAETGENVEEM